MNPILFEAITHNNKLRFQHLLDEEDVVQEIIEVWPSLAKTADKDGLTLLHHACESGQLEIARMLLILNPDLALLYDNYGFGPLHLAAMQNNASIFKEFEALAPFAFTMLTNNQETLFHLAVRNNHYEACVSLMQILGDSNNLINYCDQEGNHLLHLAVSYGCIEVAEYLINKAQNLQLETRNYAGLTALDMLEMCRQDDLIYLHLKDLLLKKLAEGTNSTSEIELIMKDEDFKTRSGIFTPRAPRRKTPYPSFEDWEEILKQKNTTKGAKHDHRQIRYERKMREIHMESLQNGRNNINIIAILISTVTYTACLSPPGGFFQEGPHIGKPVLGQTMAFKVFAICNDVALFLSLGIVVVLVSIIPFRKKPMRVLLCLTHKLLCLALSFLAASYIAARWATTLQFRQQKLMFRVVLSCGVFLGMIFVVLIIMLINNKLKKSEWKKKQDDEQPDCMSFSVDSDLKSQVHAVYYFY